MKNKLDEIKELSNFRFSYTSILNEEADLMLLGLYEEEIESEKINSLNEKLNGQIKQLIKLEKFKAKAETSLCINTFDKFKAKKILLIGLGKKEEIKDLNIFRKNYAFAIRKAFALKAKNLTTELFSIDKIDILSLKEMIRSAVQVMLLAPYNFTEYKTKKDDDNNFEKISDIKLFLNESLKQENELIEKEIQRAVISSKAVNLSRDLIMKPANEITPEYLTKVARDIKEKYSKQGLSLDILDEDNCADLEMNAFLSVAKGSHNEPYLIHFNYKPEGKAKKHIAFIGKGLTFDSGGLSLKPAKGMGAMKHDMSGAAAVMGLMSVIAELKPEYEVTAVIATCENMPDGRAYRPGDVIKSMSGKTIEIDNTDAEGRVTLADAIHYAKQEKPDEIIDIATLTGAVVVALGESAAGIMTNNQDMLDKVKKAFDLAGERVWQLPLYKEYEDGVLKDTIADVLNTGSKGQAGSQNGGCFIKQFVGETPWVHLDIAGACWPERFDTHYTPKNNPAGFGVLGFIKYLED